VKIRVHIDRVVLHGLSAENPRLLRQTFEHQLARHLREGGLSPRLNGGAAVPKISGGAVHVNQTQSGKRLGSDIACAVYRGIGRTR
jgi:hypothetical protein